MFKKTLDILYYHYELIFNHIPLLIRLYKHIHFYSVKKEIALAQIKSTDHVLHIGCGAIPYTAIILASTLRAQVTGIDHESKITRLADSVVKKFQLSPWIEIKTGDGEDYDISEYDVIILSYGIKNAEKVLRNVITHLKINGRIILRRYIREHDPYIETIISANAKFKKRLLLTQESIILEKINIKP